MKIVFLDEDTVVLNRDIDLSRIRALGQYEGYSLLPSDNPVHFCSDAEVIIVNKVRINREHIDQLQKLELISVAATGYDNIDIQAAAERSVHVSNVAGYASETVVQHVFAMVLCFSNRIMSYHDDVIRGEWQKSKMFGLLKYHTFELAGKTFGIIGFGAIGRKAAHIAEAFGMHVSVYEVAGLSGTKYENQTLDEVLEESDVLSVHCPLTEKTRNLINAGSLRRMKKTSVLINTARGGIVNERDLADALNRGEIAGAGVDTLSVEPPVEGNPLLGDVKNLIITPHSAWTARDARQRLMNKVADRIESFSEGNREGLIV